MVRVLQWGRRGRGGRLGGVHGVGGVTRSEVARGWPVASASTRRVHKTESLYRVIQ